MRIGQVNSPGNRVGSDKLVPPSLSCWLLTALWQVGPNADVFTLHYDTVLTHSTVLGVT